MTSWTSRFALIVVCLATAACDRVTKLAATATLSGGDDRSYFSDTLRLTYAENTGGFLSLGADLPASIRTLVFVVGTGIMLCALGWYAWRKVAGPWQQFGLALFLLGGTLNWIDRVIQGHVIDFMILGVGPVSTGVFNVADVALMVGAISYAVAEFADRLVDRRVAKNE